METNRAASGQPSSHLPATALDVLDFWFGPAGSAVAGTNRPEWFRKDPNFDTQIREHFGTSIEQGLRGELAGWRSTPRGALAEIVVLDQFTRNAFRDTPRAFAGDARALAAARALVAAGHDQALAPFERAFAYLPCEHAEDRAAQAESVRLFTALAAFAPETHEQLDYARRHQVIVDRFGRFPHRNAILGRPSTPEEIEFLKQPGSGF